MEIDLYLQIQKNLVRGYNIQTLEVRSWKTSSGKVGGDIAITYLNGEFIKFPQDPVLETPQERADFLEDILNQILEIQATGCYPQSENPCELGIISLN